jgi:hypothetical protein
MMSRLDDRKDSIDAAPPRLSDQPGETSHLLMEANEEYGRGLDEVRAWRALQEQGRRPRPGRLWIPLCAALAISTAVVLVLISEGWRPQNETSKAKPAWPRPRSSAQPEFFAQRPEAEPVPQTSQPAKPIGASISLKPAFRSKEKTKTRVSVLREGRTVLTDGSEVRLDPRSQAELRSTIGKGTTIALLSGAVELSVAPQRGGPLDVIAGAITFRVVGTRFRVSLGTPQPQLEVSEGTVAVLRGGQFTEWVTAGQRWPAAGPAASEALAPAPMVAAKWADPRVGAAAQPSRPSHPVGNTDPCLAMARQGRGREAVACLQPLTSGMGLSAEMAMYETARLQRDVLGDFGSALATLQTYVARFPQGALLAEARLSQVDLLARLRRTQEALAESSRLLSAAAGRERAADLHLLRGDLLRDQAGDCEQAIREYASAEGNRGAVGAQATLGRAICLEQKGRLEEAADAYRACIGRGQGRTAAEARSRLERMERR